MPCSDDKLRVALSLRHLGLCFSDVRSLGRRNCTTNPVLAALVAFVAGADFFGYDELAPACSMFGPLLNSSIKVVPFFWWMITFWNLFWRCKNLSNPANSRWNFELLSGQLLGTTKTLGMETEKSGRSPWNSTRCLFGYGSIPMKIPFWVGYSHP